MTIYAADIMDLAKPIATKEAKPKKERKRKVKEEVPSTPPNKVEHDETNPPPAPKRPMSEARMAALEKAKETRKRKREEVLAARAAEEAEIKAKEEEIKAKEEEIARKKEEAKEKRRLKREAKKQESTPPASEPSEPTEPTEPAVEIEERPVKVRKLKLPRDDSIPPTWFQKYVEGVKQEEAKQAVAAIPKKQVTEQARQVAQSAWEDGLTRDRLQHEVDNHMGRMYSMIFHNRKFK